MAKKGLILCDTNILLGYIHNHSPTVSKVAALTDDLTDWSQMCISIITYGEILPTTRKKDRKKMQLFLRNFKMVHLDQRVSRLTKEFMNESYYYKGLLADAMIGSTAIVNGLPIWTYNKQDFKQFRGVQFFEWQAWSLAAEITKTQTANTW